MIPMMDRLNRCSLIYGVLTHSLITKVLNSYHVTHLPNRTLPVTYWSVLREVLMKTESSSTNELALLSLVSLLHITSPARLLYS